MGHILCPRRINAVQFLTCVRGAVDICTPALTVDICRRLYAAERVTYAPLWQQSLALKTNHSCAALIWTHCGSALCLFGILSFIYYKQQQHQLLLCLCRIIIKSISNESPALLLLSLEKSQMIAKAVKDVNITMTLIRSKAILLPMLSLINLENTNTIFHWENYILKVYIYFAISNKFCNFKYVLRVACFSCRLIMLCKYIFWQIRFDIWTNKKLYFEKKVLHFFSLTISEDVNTTMTLIRCDSLPSHVF